MRKIVAYPVLLCLILFSVKYVSALTVSEDAKASIVMSQTVPFETIDKGDMSHFRYGDLNYLGSEMVIRQGKMWAWFWNMHTQDLDPAPPLPKVDFSRSVVLIVMLGNQPSQGPAVEISSIEPIFSSYFLSVNGLRVSVKENRTPGDLPVMTNPYHIVKVPKYDTFVFEHESPDITCSDSPQCGAADECCRKKLGDCDGQGVCVYAPPVACAEIYNPVCGCDGKTYGNRCRAAVAGVSVSFEGECDSRHQR